MTRGAFYDRDEEAGLLTVSRQRVSSEELGDVRQMGYMTRSVLPCVVKSKKIGLSTILRFDSVLRQVWVKNWCKYSVENWCMHFLAFAVEVFLFLVLVCSSSIIVIRGRVQRVFFVKLGKAPSCGVLFSQSPALRFCGLIKAGYIWQAHTQSSLGVAVLTCILLRQSSPHVWGQEFGWCCRELVVYILRTTGFRGTTVVNRQTPILSLYSPAADMFLKNRIEVPAYINADKLPKIAKAFAGAFVRLITRLCTSLQRRTDSSS